MPETSTLTAAAPRTWLARTAVKATGPTANVVALFILLQVVCQLILLIPGTTPLRMFVRTAAFGVSLLFLLLIPARTKLHPATRAIYAAIFITALGLLHPTTNNALAGMAHVGLYLAIVAPLFWVAGLRIDAQGFRRVMYVIWGFHSLSVFVGLLQIYFPGYFVPDVNTMHAYQSWSYRESLRFTLAGGERVWRPLGLTDWPGGAGNSGIYVLLFALGFLFTDKRWWAQLVYLASIGVALLCIYMCQVRSLFVMAAISLITYTAALLFRRDAARLLRVVLFVGALVVAAFFWAITVGGRNITARLETLLEGDPAAVYYRNRGLFLEQTINEHLPEYPLGAGLGRWGMVNSYFGDKTDPDRKAMWVEIQWTGWVFDGGLPLVLAYGFAVGLAVWVSWRTALNHSLGDLSLWAVSLFAYNMGVVALLFNYAPFMGQTGLEFWLLNATLFAALPAATAAKEQEAPRPA